MKATIVEGQIIDVDKINIDFISDEAKIHSIWKNIESRINNAHIDMQVFTALFTNKSQIWLSVVLGNLPAMLPPAEKCLSQNRTASSYYKYKIGWKP